jgi:transposase
VDPNADPRDARITQLERLFQAVVARADALEREVTALQEEKRLFQAVVERTEVLEREVATLKAANAELTAQLGQTSRNTSKPPSTDPPGVTRPGPKPTGRKRGGQLGHQGSERRMLKPDHIVNHRPQSCGKCGHALMGEDPEPSRFQVFELPRLRPEVTEHRGHTLRCRCGAETSEAIPMDVLQHGFGPRMTALVGYLSGRCRLSKRQIVEFGDEVLGLPISAGGVCSVEQDVSAALAAPYEEVASAVRAAPVVNADESGWREDKKLAWLWVGVTSVAIVFRVARGRGAAIAQELLGEKFAGLLVTDRWSAYNWVSTLRRQLCWAHLLRDFQGMIDRGGVGGTLATQLLAQAAQMFDWWHRVCDGELERAEFQQRMIPVRSAVADLLRDAQTRAEPKTAGMCKQILKFEPALWTFVDTDGIEPTNNAAERAIRPAILWRKGSFGNDSAVGSRFTERILTAVATVRLRRGSVLNYLAEACASYRATRTALSLLSVPTAE